MKSLSVALVIGLLTSAIFPIDAAWPEVKKKVPGAAVPQGVLKKRVPGTAVPLTTNECAGLGGDVVDGPRCNTGSACKVVTKNRGVRYLCITKRN